MTRRRFGIPELFVAITLIAILTMSVRVPISPDMWWHLRCGQVQWETRSVIKEDLFSHTAQGTPWVNQSWLPQIVMYGLYALGGLPALSLAVAALTTVAFALVLLGMQTEGRYDHFWRALVIVGAAISTGRTWVPRPQMVTLVLTAAWVLILDRHHSMNPKKWTGLFWLPPLMVLWANSHGGYIVGFILLALQMGGILARALQERSFAVLWVSLRPLLVVTGLCLVAALLNPQGIRLVLFPFQTLNSGAQQNLIAEWASPDFHALDMLPFLGLLIATWSALAFSGEQIAAIDWLRLAAFTVIGLRSGRYIGLAAIVMAPLLYRYGKAAWNKWRPSAPKVTPPTRGIPALNWLLLILVLFAAGVKVALPLQEQTIQQVTRTLFPTQAVEYLRTHGVQDNLFNEYGWGGYLIWELADSLVFIDGRADPFGDELIIAYQKTVSARPGWDKVLHEYQVNTVLVQSECALASALGQSSNWQETYRDLHAIIFQRTSNN